MTGRRLVWTLVLDAVVLLPLMGAVISSFSRGSSGLVNLSTGLGLLATSMLAVVVLLVSRVRGLTRALGLELGNDLHRRLAVAATVLAVAHVVAAVAAAPNGLAILDLLHTTGAARAATGATVALLLIPTVVVPRTSSRRYALRSRMHALLATVVLVLVGVHVILLWRTITDPLVAVPLGALTLLVLAVLLRRWVLRPLFDRDAYVVRGVRPESPSTSTVVLAPARRDRVPTIDPGQFVWLRLRREVTTSAEHPFTVADSSRPGFLELTIRSRGQFTSDLHDLEPGRRVWLDGPHGAFVPPGIRDSGPGLVLVAGGVGITPIISILRALAAADDPRELRLLLVERPDEALFGPELDVLTRRLALSVTRLTGRRIDAAVLTGVLPPVPDLVWHDYFLCGPPQMVGATLNVLDALGVPGERIHTEQFG